MNFHKNIILLSLFFVFFFKVSAQVGIGTTNPDPSSVLDVESTSAGVLIPRVALNSINDVTTIVSPATSLLVYNTNTTIGVSSVTPGFYYWDGSQWSRFKEYSDKVYGEIFDNSGKGLARNLRQDMDTTIPIRFNGLGEMEGVIPVPDSAAPPTFNGFEIVTSGIYRVTYSLSIDMFKASEPAPNPVTLGFYLSTGTNTTGIIPGSYSHTRVTHLGNSSCSMTKIIHLNAGNIIRLYTDSTLTVVYVIPSSATMNIELIEAD